MTSLQKESLLDKSPPPPVFVLPHKSAIRVASTAWKPPRRNSCQDGKFVRVPALADLFPPGSSAPALPWRLPAACGVHAVLQQAATLNHVALSLSPCPHSDYVGDKGQRPPRRPPPG